MSHMTTVVGVGTFPSAGLSRVTQVRRGWEDSRDEGDFAYPDHDSSAVGP